jgi:glycosyltransferase involved in cell wall biosynthesis
MKDGVSIIIPTLNGGSIFDTCINKIRHQDYSGDVQLIVIDSGSTDGTPDLAKKAGAVVKRIDKKEFHHAGTRNAALSLARCDRVIFMVQDAVPCSCKWLSDLEEVLTENDVVAVYTDQVPHDDADIYARFEIESISKARGEKPVLQHLDSPASFNKMPYDKAYRAIGLDNVCAIYRKESLLKTPFPDVGFAEDLAWAFENLFAGNRIIYQPHIKVKHSHNRKPEYGFNRQIINSYWCARIMKRVKDDLSFVTIKDLMQVTGRFERFCNQVLSDGVSGNQTRGDRDKNSIRVIGKVLKRYSVKDRAAMFVFHNFLKDSKPLCNRVEKIERQAREDVRHSLSLIKENYPVRSEEELLGVLEQIVASILGRIYGEVYASCMLAERRSPRLEDFIRPYLKGV